jgi:hypothetical protein
MSMTKIANEYLESGGIIKSSSNPTITTGGSLGDVYLNTTTGELFSLTDATVGANVWSNIGRGTGNVSPFTPTIATGGTITIDGDYKVHTFISSGTFTISQIGDDNLRALVIAGGGGGGSASRGAGGGAGGLIESTSITPTIGGLTVTIGAGGLSGPYSSTSNSDGRGTNGSNTVFSTLTAIGGGRGGSSDNAPQKYGTSGGSGGGSWVIVGQAGQGTAGQGNDGGDGHGGQPYGGGGGGAGQSGRASNDPSFPSKGGDGLQIDISGSPVYYAGGGSGSGFNRDDSYAGGLGGGGMGKGGPGGNPVGVAPMNGTANLGGGGGTSGNGGSGLVIIRYKFQ